MASFDKYSNYNENTSFSSVVFGAEKPVLEVELNEMQQIIASKIKKLCDVLGVGFYPLNENNITYDNTNKTVTVSGGIIISPHGVAEVKESISVTVSTTNPYVYFELQEVDLTKDSTIHAYGNAVGSVISNTILDSRVGIETTRRKALVYTLKAGVQSNLTNVKYIGVGTFANSSFSRERVGLDKFKNDVITILANPVFTNSISLGRRTGSTVGAGSVAVGYDNVASGKYSFAQGEDCTASDMRTSATGFNTTASASNAHAEGHNSVASGLSSHAEGSTTTASGHSAHTEGNLTKATAEYTHAEGSYSEANAIGAHAEGSDTRANGRYSHAEGIETIALQNQHAQGHFNDETIATENSDSGVSTGTAFVIGNGTSSVKSNAFRVQSDGATYAKGAYNATGADYAEYAEWADGNPDNEDRRGYFVTFDEEKPSMIRKANSSDVYVLGVVSGNPCVIGNSDECWLGKNLFDEFNSPIYEDVEETFKEITETGEVTTRTTTVQQYKVNPDYDPTQKYVHRRDRKEWSAVGWIGVLPVRDDSTCEVGGFCTWSDNGLATKAEPSRFNYKVLERVNDNIIKIALK